MQVKELGARSMKFYNGHVEGTWRCDDREVAYPMYERCQALGIDVLQFHKGMPFGLSNVEDVRPNDLQGAARDFPDLTFVIHHLGMPYFDETVSIAARFPNVHLALSANLCFTPIAPRLVQTQLGRLLMEVEADKLLWGSEAGGLELDAVAPDGTVRVRFTGLCTGCPYRPLTMAGTVRPALLQARGGTAVEATGSRISAEAEARLAALLDPRTGPAPIPPGVSGG